MVATAASVETRVLVLRLLKGMATVLPVKLPSIDFGIEPDLMAFLCETAFRINVTNSVELRSAMERRCRGANGEVSSME